MKENKKNLQSQEPLNIYSAKLKFTKEKNGQVSKDIVRVTIRYFKKRRIRRKDLRIPDYISTDELNWVRYRGKPISIYHRRNKGQGYVDNGGMIVHTDLCQKLEELVSKVCLENSKQT